MIIGNTSTITIAILFDVQKEHVWLYVILKSLIIKFM